MRDPKVGALMCGFFGGRDTRHLLHRALRVLEGIERKVAVLMTKQEDLDAFVARIDAATAGIRQDIADIKAANPAVDFTALEERVAGLEGLDAENPVPAPENPAP